MRGCLIRCLALVPCAIAARIDRRAALRAGAAGAALQLAPAARSASLAGYDPAGAVTRPAAGRSYFPPLTPPLTNRATYRYELGRDAWALEQVRASRTAPALSPHYENTGVMTVVDSILTIGVFAPVLSC